MLRSSRRASAAAAEATAEALKPAPHARRYPHALLILLLTYALATAARLAVENSVDDVLAKSDFDGGRARVLLQALCAEGPRVAGSAHAERDAVRLLMKELGDIKLEADAAGATLEVETVSGGSGGFYTDFLDGFVVAYDNVTSVAARLSWPRARRDAVLLGAHFDSFPTSPGSSDNAVNVAAAVGVLRALAQGPAQSHSVLVLLNGGEESMFVAAHAFALSHRWARDYRVVLNLEAIGAGGPSVVFQLGPDAAWLARAVGGSRRPRGTVIAHDLFQVPGFPAATDWKTLVRHAPSASGLTAGLAADAAATDAPPVPVGLDMATLGNGYVYHTPLDAPDRIGPAQVQALGAGILSITRAVLRALEARRAVRHAAGAPRAAPAVVRRAAHENSQSLDGAGPGAVYFDFCSVLWIAYSRGAARPLHLLAALLALAAIGAAAATARQLLAELAALLAAVLAAAAVGLFLWAVRPLATFGSETLAIALYAPLALAAGLAARSYFDGRGARAAPTAKAKAAAAAAAAPGPVAAALAQQLGAASLAPWLIMLAGFESAGLGTAYLPALFCASNGVALLAAHALAPRAPRAAAAAQLGGAMLPTLHLNSICGWLLQVLVPITGRSGPLPADLLVGASVALSTALPAGSLLAPLAAEGHTRPLSRAAAACAALALCTALLREPFTAATPKRLLVHHVGRELDGVPLDSGMWISAFDSAGLRELRALPSLGLPTVSRRSPHRCDLDLADTGCYFSFPYYFPLSGALGRPDGSGAVYAREFGPPAAAKPATKPTPIAPPTFPKSERLTMEHLRTNSSGGGGGGEARTHRLHLRFSGSAQMTLVLPEERLAGWSFAPGVPPPRRSPFAPDERVVFAFLISGGGSQPGGGRRVWEFWLDVRGDEPLPLAAYSHHVGSTRTRALEELASRLPQRLRGDWHWSASSLARRTLQLV